MGIKLDGKKFSEKIMSTIMVHMSKIKERPHLVVLTTGDDDASKIYVKNKEKACKTVNMRFTHKNLRTESQEEIEAEIERLGKDRGVHGILVQLPLREGLNEEKILSRIAPEKDVDCFHPINLGLLFRGDDEFAPCTPLGIPLLLEHNGISLDGKLCVVIGRSNIVGKPLAIELLNQNATPIICHSHTKNLIDLTRQADVVISATGQAKMITPNYIKEGVILVDVGMNRDENGKLCGDIDPACYEKSSYYTPVPNGVGKVTIAMLLINLIACYNRTKEVLKLEEQDTNN